jgi:hypothetical protein
VKFVGGFKGVSKEGMIVRPHLSMAIIDAEGSSEEMQLGSY